METTGHTGGPVPGGRPVPEPRGLIDGLLSLFGSFGRYFEAIGALAIAACDLTDDAIEAGEEETDPTNGEGEPEPS